MALAYLLKLTQKMTQFCRQIYRTWSISVLTPMTMEIDWFDPLLTWIKRRRAPGKLEVGTRNGTDLVHIGKRQTKGKHIVHHSPLRGKLIPRWGYMFAH